jgi:hypothetical protein
MVIERHRSEAYETAGERYRTPAHPDMIETLGRAMWNALALEEQVVAILYEAGAADWRDARRLTAGRLEERLRELGPELAAEGAGPAVPIVIEQAADAFGDVRRRYRNALAHARAYTAGHGADGRVLPGLAHDRKDGRVERFSDPDALLRAAHEIEKAIDPLGEARIVVRLWRGIAGPNPVGDGADAGT